MDIRRFQSGQTFHKDKINKRENKYLRKLPQVHPPYIMIDTSSTK
ncbi:IS110 family transposase [Radiobacillus deserti]|uniref:IS110 family transposase n=1 Tax=Radiobacillus deserti TaxID=2594883 RepID=A0A516KL06_9BACI|nr:IS110 family transposase [Radiobacillus deserti]